MSKISCKIWRFPAGNNRRPAGEKDSLVDVYHWASSLHPWTVGKYISTNIIRGGRQTSWLSPQGTRAKSHIADESTVGGGWGARNLTVGMEWSSFHSCGNGMDFIPQQEWNDSFHSHRNEMTHSIPTGMEWTPFHSHKNDPSIPAGMEWPFQSHKNGMSFYACPYEICDPEYSVVYYFPDAFLTMSKVNDHKKYVGKN